MASVNEVFEYLSGTESCIDWEHSGTKIAFLRYRLEKLERELPLKLAGNGVTKFFGDAKTLDELNKMEVECKKEATAMRELFKAQYDVFAALAEVEIRVAEAFK